MQTAAIHADGLTKYFGQGEARTMALKNVGLEAYFGEMLYIVGPSGSGKTTLLSVLSGILRPDAGSVSVEGADIWNLGSDKLADFRLHKIGFVFQDYHLFPRLTTAENVAVPLVLKRVDWSTALQEAVKYLEIVGLKGRAGLPPVKLSGGEQQRVAIARAIICEPKILLADEPTGNLDTENSQVVLAMLRELNRTFRQTILMITHNPEAAAVADRIIRMRDGRIISD
jgi:putative ABC transport system ATP-binding protein